MGRLNELLKGIPLPPEADALIAQAERLLDESQKTASYIEYLELENARLRKQLGVPDAGAGLSFDPATGTHIDPSEGLRYCTRCLAGNNRSALNAGAHGWQCMVCNKFYSDPSTPRPQISPEADLSRE